MYKAFQLEQSPTFVISVYIKVHDEYNEKLQACSSRVREEALQGPQCCFPITCSTSSGLKVGAVAAV